MKECYSPHRKQLLFIGSEATAGYWDAHWTGKIGGDLREKLLRNTSESLVLRITRTYLKPADGPILEGGCGRGHYVYELQKHGYECIGVDFAAETVEILNTQMPELDIRQGDVSKLDFPDDAFVGYWSLGVIEHFYDGYEPIAEEMLRVVRPGGYVFLVFPHFSLLRKLKARLGLYERIASAERPDGFYQFGLDAKEVMRYYRSLGFEVVTYFGKDGLKGSMDEIPFLRPVLGYLYTYKGGNLLMRIIRKVVETLLSPVAGHSVLIVLRSRKGDSAGVDAGTGA